MLVSLSAENVVVNPVGARLIVRSADLSARVAHIDDVADKSALRTINRAPTGGFI